jgi:PAS domain S-box-containing protein/putative nucleotidyltransferase with HDIG domain
MMRDADAEETVFSDESESAFDGSSDPASASRATFEALVDSMPNAVFLKAPDDRYAVCNEEYAALVGRSRPEIIGCTDFDLFPKRVADKLFRWSTGLVDGSGGDSVEIRLPAGDRPTATFVLRGAALRDAQGGYAGFVGSAIDVTEERRVESERAAAKIMAAAAEMAIQTIEGMIDPVIILDGAGRIERVNRGYAELFGIADSPVGSPVSSLFLDYSETSAALLLRRCKDLGRIRDLEARVRDASGRILPVLANLSVLRDSQRAMDGFVLAIRDVSSLADANAHLRENDRLLRALYSISEAAYFAHDMQNLFALVHRIVARLVPADHFAIVLYDAAADAMECPYCSDAGGLAVDLRGAGSGGCGSIGVGLVERVLEEGRPLLLRSEDIRALRDSGVPVGAEPFPREWLGVPLRNGEGEIVGALVSRTMTPGNSFSDEDRKVVNFVSSQIAMAIERKRNEEQLRTKNAMLKSLTDGTILALVRAVEIRDPYTAGHQQRVAKLAYSIADRLGLSEDRKEATRVAALLHDVGKISVPSELLSKPGRLSELEFQLIKMHPASSADILKSIDFPYPIARFVREHHEKLDGSGYPDGLSGAAISLESRIICVADVADAMASHRPYRPSLGIELALEELSSNAGVLYDSDVVSACRAVFAEGSFDFCFVSSEPFRA